MDSKYYQTMYSLWARTFELTARSRIEVPFYTPTLAMNSQKLSAKVHCTFILKEDELFYKQLFPFEIPLIYSSSLFYYYLLRAHQNSWHKGWVIFLIHKKCKLNRPFSPKQKNQASLEVSLYP